VTVLKITDAIAAFRKMDRLGVYVFSTQDLKKMFCDEDANTLKKSLQKLVRNHVLTKASKGIYVFDAAKSRNSFIIEQIALVLRRGHYSYVSLESALSEYGVISQIPISRITVMTTGRKGEYKTPFGIIEFTHTQKNLIDLLSGISYSKGRPLPIAKVDIAKKDLRRVGRNVNMIQE
jgi:predicted transcriptional regulator of viral defense system